jgi:cysteine synthase A
MAYGTGGTLLGVSRCLKAHSPNTKIHVCEPSNAPMLYSDIDTTYADGGKSPLPTEAHPVWRPHLFQGWATDFIPKLVQQFCKEHYDSFTIVPTSGFEAIKTSQRMAREERLFSGTSGGGIVYAALELAKKSPPGTNILAIVPDTGERYLYTPLFADIPADMTTEEKKLAASTPSEAPPKPALPSKTPESVDFVHRQNTSNKVVVWSLEYCEFCWTLTRFLDRLGVPYERINIDSFQYAKDQMGNKYRDALVEETDCPTFPQFFLQGKFLGGAVDACMMWKKGELEPLLEEAGLKNNDFNEYEGDPFEFLPKWMTANPLGDK